MGSGIFVRYVPFPDVVRAVTLPNCDSTFDIYINSRLPQELQEAALDHELNHIRQDHFYHGSVPIWKIEEDAG